MQKSGARLSKELFPAFVRFSHEQHPRGRERRVDDVDLKRSKTQGENHHLPPPEDTAPGLDITDETRQRGEQKQRAKGFVISGGPCHYGRERRICRPQNRCQEAGRLTGPLYGGLSRRSRDAPQNPRDQREIRRHRDENADPEGQTVEPEQAFEQQEEPDRSRLHGRMVPCASGANKALVAESADS